MTTPNEIGDQDLTGEPVSPAPGTGHVGKAILTPTSSVTQKAPAPPRPAETAGTDADTVDSVQGTTDAARPGGTPASPPAD